MILVGTVNIQGNEYLFCRVETNNKIGWYIFNKTLTTTEGNTYRININSLIKFKVKDIKPFVVSAQESSIEFVRYFGNPFLVNTLLTTYAQVKSHNFTKTEGQTEQISEGALVLTSQSDEQYNYYEISEFIKGFNLESVVNEDSTEKTNLFDKLKKNMVYKSFLYSLNFKFKGVELKTLEQTIRTPKNSTMNLEGEDLEGTFEQKRLARDASLADKQKSLSQLRLIKDLSWLLDDKGRLKKNYTIIDTYEKLKWYAENVFPKIKFWVVDVESTGLAEYLGDNPEDFDHIVSIMMSWEEDQAIFIPIDMAYMTNIHGGDWKSILKYWLEKIDAGGHNIGFDARALYVDFGIKLKILHDSQQLNFNINCHRAKFNNGLKYLEEKLLGVSPLELKDIFGSNKLAGLFRYIKDPLLALCYACPDTSNDLKIIKILWEQLPVSSRDAYKLDMDTIVHVYQMDYIGNRIDIKLATKLREANNADRDFLAEMIYSLVGQSLVFKEKFENLQYRFNNKLINTAELEKELTEFINSDTYKNARYKFDINSGKKLGEIMFNHLGYPIQGRSKKTQLPTVDAKTLGALLRFKGNTSVRLKKNILSHESDVYDSEVVLINAKEYNELEYPLALLITEYRLRNKRDTTFFKQLLDTSIEGRYYSQSKMASAETFRIINVIQTLQGFMKKLILPYSDDYYLVVFDFSQIEYRFMAGLGKQDDLSVKLNSYRADFHKECCALLHKIQAYQVTHKMRKQGKSLNFAIPYGMGDYNIAENLFKKVTIKTLQQARIQLAQWKKIFSKIWDYLEARRDEAIEQGYVENPLHRKRYFYNGTNYGEFETDEEALKDWKETMDKKKEKAIRRAAGNFPIQSGAADLFKIAMRDFRRRLEREGLADKVLTTAVVHDEMVNSVHKSVNPYYLYRIIWEEAMKQVKGHPRYYAGISVCDNWYEGKDDLYEAPIEFVYHMINSPESKEKFVYQEDAKNNVLNDIKKYMNSVFMKEFEAVGMDLTKSEIDLRSMLPEIKDYFIRDKIPTYYKLPKYKGSLLKDYDDDSFIRSFEEFVLRNKILDSYTIIYPEDYPTGKKAVLTDSGRTFIDEVGNTLKVEVYIEKSETKEKSKVTKEELELNLGIDLLNGDDSSDLNLNLDLVNDEEYKDSDDYLGLAEDTESDDIRINQLRLFELTEDGEEGGIFANDIYYVDKSANSIEDEMAEINANPEKYNKVYDEFTSNIRTSADRLIVEVDNMTDSSKQAFVDYINNHLTTKDDLAGIEVVRHIGNCYDYTETYIKDFNIEDLRAITDKQLV